MRLLIVHAHPEPSSFSAAMTRQAVEALQGSGQEVVAVLEPFVVLGPQRTRHEERVSD